MVCGITPHEVGERTAAREITMNITITRIVIVLSLFALMMGAGFTGAVTAQEDAQSVCGQVQGASGLDPGAIGGVASEGEPGEFGEYIVGNCNPVIGEG